MECRKKKNAVGDDAKKTSIEDICWMAMANGRDPKVMTKLKFNGDTWLANTGATYEEVAEGRDEPHLFGGSPHHVQESRKAGVWKPRKAESYPSWMLSSAVQLPTEDQP